MEKGKLKIPNAGGDGFHCQPVSFNQSFASGTPVRVFASVNHGNQSFGAHDSAFIWVENVSTSGFKVCIVQGGWGYRGNITIDWFSFQGSQPGVQHGEASFSLFTTGTKCDQVTFSQVWLKIKFFACQMTWLVLIETMILEGRLQFFVFRLMHLGWFRSSFAIFP